jgi:hypothetical protein
MSRAWSTHVDTLLIWWRKRPRLCVHRAIQRQNPLRKTEIALSDEDHHFFEPKRRGGRVVIERSTRPILRRALIASV